MESFRDKIREAIRAQIGAWKSEGDYVSGAEAISEAFLNLRWRMERKPIAECLSDILKYRSSIIAQGGMKETVSSVSNDSHTCEGKLTRTLQCVGEGV